MIKKLMMVCIAAIAAMGAMAAGEKSAVLGDWYEAHNIDEVCMLNRWDDFAMGANVAIPVTGLASPISASDVVVTAGTYSEFGRPYVLTETEMWNRYGAPVLREKNLGNVEFDWYDNVWQNWDAEEDGAYGYELSADIWPNWSQVSGRQWILIPTGVPRRGTHTFSVKINGVEHSNYVVSFVMAEDQKPVPYEHKVSAVVADGCEAMGKVSGGKTAKAGTKLTLKATANKGYVFSHWDGPLGDGIDPRNSSISYVVGEDDAEFVAYFIPVSDDWVDVWLEMDSEYTTGEEISDIYVEVDSGSLATLKFKGLPSGLKYTAKALYDRSGNLLHEANTIYGTPKKSGVYTVTVTATTASKKKSTSSVVIVVRKENEKMVKLAVQDWYDEETDTSVIPGKVSGGGIFAEGKKLSLKAIANKGFIFAGWLDVNADTWLEGADDYRNPKLSYIMTDSDMDLEAVFMPTAEDNILDLYVEGEWITDNADDNVFYADGEVEVKLEIDSLSLPKASVSGLPKGLKFDAKTNMITGMPTAPGLYTVTVKLTNQSIKKAIQKKFKIEVSNLTGANEYFVDGLYNGEGEKYSLSVGISNIEEFLPRIELVSPTAKLAVKGLPSGLKYNAKTGEITGIATKVGTYTVTLTVTDGKAKYVSTITIDVEALPDWVVGTFRGGVESYGYDWSDALSFEVKVTPQGRVSAKLIEPVSAWGNVSLKTAGFRKDSEGNYVFVIYDGDFENGEKGSIGEVHISKSVNGMGYLYAEEVGRNDEDEDYEEFEAYWEGYQDVYSLTSSVIPMPTFKTDNKYYFNIDEDGGVQLTFGAKGAVTVSEPGVIWGKSQLLPIEYDSYNNVVIASLWLMGYDEWEDCTFGAELILTIPVSQDGAAKASEIIIKEVNAGPNW